MSAFAAPVTNACEVVVVIIVLAIGPGESSDMNIEPWPTWPGAVPVIMKVNVCGATR